MKDKFKKKKIIIEIIANNCKTLILFIKKMHNHVSGKFIKVYRMLSKTNNISVGFNDLGEI